MIKPEFWSSETLTNVSRDSRLLFIGLWNFCDDYGFCINSTRRILGDLFPLDDKVTEANIKKWLSELIAIKVIIPVEYNNKNLLYVNSWDEHQKVSHPSKRTYVEVFDIEEVIEHSRNTPETLLNDSCDSLAPKRKKKEKEKGKEKDNSKEEKDTYLESIELTKEQYQELIKKYENEENLKKYLEELNNYKMSNGKKYKSDYHVMIGWVFKKFTEDKEKQTINSNDEFIGTPNLL
ncbi:MAG: hypothetical protein ACR2PH_05585 [Desulfobulbia bacterium]